MYRLSGCDPKQRFDASHSDESYGQPEVSEVNDIYDTSVENVFFSLGHRVSNHHRLFD